MQLGKASKLIIYIKLCREPCGLPHSAEQKMLDDSWTVE